MPKDDAARLLKTGDTDFIRQTELPGNFSRAVSQLGELRRVHPAAPFYAGLLTGESGDRPELETLLYCAALESSSVPAHREAVLKLIPIILKSKSAREAADILAFIDSAKVKRKAEYLLPLRAACFYRLGRYAESAALFPAEKFQEEKGVPASGTPASDPALSAASCPAGDWGKALALFAVWRTSTGGNSAAAKDGLASFLFEVPAGEVLRWAYDEALSLEGLFNEAETGVLRARLSSGNYGVMFNSMLPALQNENGSGVFFRYPDLAADLGRAYQYTPAIRDEGVELFKSWITLLDERRAFAPSFIIDEKIDNKKINALRYTLLFYLGRMERARENYAESSEYFIKAQKIAPNALQSDACIWYTLMNAMTVSPSAAAELARSTVSEWNDISYFTDILDRLSSYFAGKRQWNDLAEIFQRLEHKGESAPLAQYAWILGRASEEGYFKTGRSAEDFFRVAYNASNASFYYRAMAASALGMNFIPGDENSNGEKTTRGGRDGISGRASPVKAASDEAEFILGFFECGAASFAQDYLRPRESALPVTDLRKIAEAFSASGRLKESLDLVSRYMDRKDYDLRNQDLFLFYPRPFLELMEKYSRETEVEPEILYGLIRTESYFTQDIVSRSGAVGLAQLMPPTAGDMADRIARQGGPDYRERGLDLTNPELSIHIGSYYLRYLSEQMGNPMLALLAYNGGMGRMRRWLAADRRHDDGGLPHDLFLETVEYPETREYGRRVLAAAAVYGYLYYGKTMAEVAAQIFAAIQS